MHGPGQLGITSTWGPIAERPTFDTANLTRSFNGLRQLRPLQIQRIIMLDLWKLGRSLTLIALAGGTLGAMSVSKQTVDDATPQGANSWPGQQSGAGDPTPWENTQDIGNGLKMVTSVGYTEDVLQASTGLAMRPLAIDTDIKYGVGLIQSINYLVLHPLTDTTPLTFTFVNIDRNIVVAQIPAFDPVTYVVTMMPKSGFTWGTINGAVDMDIVAVQQP
ncbi:MAG: hypothetical protein ACI8QZ_001856 [Chlamydiales bacterium]